MRRDALCAPSLTSDHEALTDNSDAREICVEQKVLKNGSSQFQTGSRCGSGARCGQEVVSTSSCGHFRFRVSGMGVSEDIQRALSIRFSDREGHIRFNDFVACAVKLKTAISEFPVRGACTHTRTHTHTHAHTHAHTPHAHTHTCTHTQARGQSHV